MNLIPIGRALFLGMAVACSSLPGLAKDGHSIPNPSNQSQARNFYPGTKIPYQSSGRTTTFRGSPAAPKKPAKPRKPSKPRKPLDPKRPAKPAKPAKPRKPQQPAVPQAGTRGR